MSQLIRAILVRISSIRSRADSCPAAGYARSRDCARGATAAEATPARGSREARGPFNRTARDTSRDRQRRRDAEAARRVAEGPPHKGEETWVDVATARGRRPRSPSRAAKGRGKTKDKDRDATPTMGGTIDPATDGDDTVDRSKGTGAAKGNAKGRGKGGWTPMLDRLGRIDVSYRGCPRQYLPPGARPGENLRHGDLTIRSEDAIREVLPLSDEDALEIASRMSCVRIPERGFINYRYGIQGRGSAMIFSVV